MLTQDERAELWARLDALKGKWFNDSITGKPFSAQHCNVVFGPIMKWRFIACNVKGRGYRLYENCPHLTRWAALEAGERVAKDYEQEATG